jgi:hypothetical protein
VRPELVVQKPLWIAISENIVIKFHQLFVASKQSNFLQEQVDMGLIIGPIFNLTAF